MVREMFLDQTYAPHTTAEEGGKGGGEQERVGGWCGGAQTELLDFVTGIDVQPLGAARGPPGCPASAGGNATPCGTRTES